MRNLVFFLAFMLASSLLLPALGQKLNVNYRWRCRVPASDIVDAGMDYSKQYASSEGQVRIDVSNGKKKGNIGNWSVYVHKSDVYWDDRVKIFARRTSSGEPCGSSSKSIISGGSMYQEVTDFSRVFFSGQRGFTDIRIQYKLEGVSVLVPVGEYETEIVYTISSP